MKNRCDCIFGRGTYAMRPTDDYVYLSTIYSYCVRHFNFNNSVSVHFYGKPAKHKPWQPLDNIDWFNFCPKCGEKIVKSELVNAIKEKYENDKTKAKN